MSDEVTTAEPMFGHLAAYDPTGRVKPFTLPFGGAKPDGTPLPSVLHMRHAGEGNPGWINAVAKHAAANATRSRSGKQSNAEVARDLVDRDCTLYPRHNVVGWDNVFDIKGERVPFSVEACTKLFRALPRWILDEIRLFALTPENFVEQGTPTPETVDELAGN